MAEVDLRTAAGAVPIQRDVVRVSGPEAVTYLQGQLSQDVESLPVGATARSLLLQPTGKVDAWLRVTRRADDALLLDVDDGFGEAVLARLRRFLLRTKADLVLERWAGLAVRGPDVDDDVPAAALPAGWPGIEGWDLLSEGEVALGGIPLGAPDDLEALRVELGVPAMGAELTPDTIPAEAGQWLVDSSVSFTKGCYTGQELVARIDSRGGNVPRPVRGLRLGVDDAARGTPVLRADGSEAGRLTSVARSARFGAIALAPLPRAITVGDVLLVGGVDAQVTDLPMR